MPAIVAVFFVLGIASGLLPAKWFRFTDLQIGRQVVQRDSPFIPNLQVRSDWYEGGEAVSGNLEPMEHIPPRTFTTDALGFRKTPEVRPGEPARVMIFRGFSNTWGATLSDEETISAQLARRLGVNVYNGARFHEDEETPADYDRLAAKVGPPMKTAVYVHLEPNAHTLAWFNDRRMVRLGKSIAGEWAVEEAEFARKRAGAWLRLSPLLLVTTRAKKSLENDLILPNRYRQFVESFGLPDGGRILVLKGELERARTDFGPQVVKERAEYIAFWRDELAKRGVRMVTLLVPDKMSVYGPALGLDFPETPYLVKMERDLAARGVEVVNGLPLLRARAAEDLASGRLAYRREDPHWSPLGVGRLADAVAEQLRRVPGF